MAAIEWNVDLGVQASSQGTWLSYTPGGTALLVAALRPNEERLWFYPSNNMEFGQPVMSGGTLYLGSFAGTIVHHWLTFPAAGGDLLWVPWGAFEQSNAWIITATDGSAEIDEGTPFVLQAGAGGGFMGINTADGDVGTVPDESDALILTASLMESERSPLQQIFARRR